MLLQSAQVNVRLSQVLTANLMAGWPNPGHVIGTKLPVLQLQSTFSDKTATHIDPGGSFNCQVHEIFTGDFSIHFTEVCELQRNSSLAGLELRPVQRESTTLRTLGTHQH